MAEPDAARSCRAIGRLAIMQFPSLQSDVFYSEGRQNSSLKLEVDDVDLK